MTNKLERKFIRKLNTEILPSINFPKLGASYLGDREYAKQTLEKLHSAFISVYGTDDMTMLDENEESVMLPGIVRAQNSGAIAIALLSLDLTSSGELCDTTFLTQYGVLNQFEKKTKPQADNIRSFIPYDYFYCVTYEDDIHCDQTQRPDDISSLMPAAGQEMSSMQAPQI